jgi:hypothetical protein
MNTWSRCLFKTNNLHKAEIADILKRMTHEGLLVSEGYGRGMRYLLPQKSLGFIKEHDSNVATSEANMARNMASSETNMARNMASSEANMASNMASSVKKRMSRDELFLLILANCKDWTSLESLSSKINRNPKYLRNFIIPILLASKKLQMMYPGTPKHPNQQYKISD